jgi:hypothetical protein
MNVKYGIKRFYCCIVNAFELILYCKQPLMGKLLPLQQKKDTLRVKHVKRKIFSNFIKNLSEFQTADFIFQGQDNNNNKLEEDFRNTIAQAQQLSNSKVDIMNESDIDKTIEDWLTEEEEKRKEKDN